MRRASKVDANHAEIRDTLRKLGATVYDMSGVGRGLPDLLVTVRGKKNGRGRDLWVEVKDGRKPPSGRRLTKAQAVVHAAWEGAPIVVLTSVEQAVDWWRSER